MRYESFVHCGQMLYHHNLNLPLIIISKLTIYRVTLQVLVVLICAVFGEYIHRLFHVRVCACVHLSHHHNLICEEVQQTRTVSQISSNIKFQKQSLTEKHHILHQCGHLSFMPLITGV